MNEQITDEAIYELLLTEWRYAPAGSPIFRDVKIMERLAAAKRKLSPEVVVQISNYVSHPNRIEDTPAYWADMAAWIKRTGKYSGKTNQTPQNR